MDDVKESDLESKNGVFEVQRRVRHVRGVSRVLAFADRACKIKSDGKDIKNNRGWRTRTQITGRYRLRFRQIAVDHCSRVTDRRHCRVATHGNTARAHIHVGPVLEIGRRARRNRGQKPGAKQQGHDAIRSPAVASSESRHEANYIPVLGMRGLIWVKRFSSTLKGQGDAGTDF